MIGNLSRVLVATTLVAAATTSPGSVAVPLQLLGAYCTPETHLSREVDETGYPYMYGYGKQICDETGGGGIVIVLHEGNIEVERNGVESVDTNVFTSIAFRCGLNDERADWILVAEYTDLALGKTRQFKKLENVDCSI